MHKLDHSYTAGKSLLAVRACVAIVADPAECVCRQLHMYMLIAITCVLCFI